MRFPSHFRIGPVAIAPATVLAPMAGVTDTVFRRLIRNQGGCGLIMTEFTSSHGVVRVAQDRANPRAAFRYLYFEPEEHPISAQLFGSDPQVMADAARVCQDLGFDIVDINFGCPVNKVVKCNGGSGLLRDLPLVEEILRNVRAAISIPLTMKFRAGWNDQELVAVQMAQAGRRLRPAGGRAASAHARARLQRQRRLDAHRGGEGRGEDSGDRQRRHSDAGRRRPHGSGDRLRRRDDRARRFVESVDFPADSAVSGDRALTIIPPNASATTSCARITGCCASATMPDTVGKMKQFATYFTHGVRNGSKLRVEIYKATEAAQILDHVDAFFERELQAVSA